MKVCTMNRQARALYAAAALLLGGHAAFAANVLWVSDFFADNAFSPPGDNVNDTNFVRLLQNAGHNVWRFNPGGQNVNLTQAQIDAINTNDLIILGRALDSAHFQGTPAMQWNTNITKPIIVQSSYLLRNNRLGWFAGTAVPDGTPTAVTAVDLNDPVTAYIFNGVPMANTTNTANPYDEAVDRNTSHTTDNPVAGGRIIARGVVNTGWKVIAEWPANTLVRGTDTLAGYRMFFAAGSREAASPIQNAGKENLTASGETLFLNAIQIALNNGNLPGNPTAPVITNQPQSLSVTQGLPASFAVGAEGFPLNYHWHFNGVAIPGANDRTYSIPSVDFAHAGDYTVIVSNASGMATSEIATLTVPADTIGPALLRAIGNAAGDAITLTYSEPVDSSVGAEVGNYAVFRVSDNQELGILNATLVNGINLILTNVSSRIVGENYRVQALDIPDRFGNPLDPNPGIVPVRPEVLLAGFDSNNEWKYEISGADLTTSGWQQPGYDDSGWSSGLAPLGLDASAGTGVQPAIRTTLPYDSAKLTTYFRRRFDLPALPAGATLQLRHVVEDGAIYYLNGQEVFRHRMPAGAVAYNTSATGAPDPTPIEGPFTISATNLLEGENVLAVSVHQSGTASTDLEFAAELIASVPEYLVRPPIISVQPQSQVVEETRPASLSVTLSQGSQLNYQWYFNNNVLNGATNRFLNFASAQPANQGDYFVVVSNPSGIETSSVASLTVILDTNPPVVRSVRAMNLSNVVVIFSEPVDPASAATPGNYSFAEADGDCCSFASTATLSNSTAVILTLDAPLASGTAYDALISEIADRVATPNILDFAQFPVRMPGSSAGNIVWVSDNPGPNGFSGPVAGFDDDVFVTNFLQAAGYNVIRFSSDNAGTNLLTVEEIAALNTNDLIIVSRATASGAFSPPQGSQWNTSITTPMIVMSSYLLRTNNLSWFLGSDVPDDTQTTLATTNISDPVTAYLFQDVALTFSGNQTVDPYDHPLDRNTSMITGPAVPGGVVLATAVQNGNATAIASFPAGTEVRGGTETLSGYRMYFAGGSREVSGVQTAGKDNLTPTGEALFLRAVEIALNGGSVPGSGSQQRIINPSYSGGTFSGAIQTANGVTYEVQYKTDLNAAWQTLGPIIGDGTLKTFTDPGATGPMRFYQVVVP